jgi:hypothetical protein
LEGRAFARPFFVGRAILLHRIRADEQERDHRSAQLDETAAQIRKAQADHRVLRTGQGVSIWPPLPAAHARKPVAPT